MHSNHGGEVQTHATKYKLTAACDSYALKKGHVRRRGAIRGTFLGETGRDTPYTAERDPTGRRHVGKWAKDRLSTCKHL